MIKGIINERCLVYAAIACVYSWCHLKRTVVIKCDSAACDGTYYLYLHPHNDFQASKHLYLPDQ